MSRYSAGDEVGTYIEALHTAAAAARTPTDCSVLQHSPVMTGLMSCKFRSNNSLAEMQDRL